MATQEEIEQLNTRVAALEAEVFPPSQPAVAASAEPPQGSAEGPSSEEGEGEDEKAEPEAPVAGPFAPKKY